MFSTFCRFSLLPALPQQSFPFEHVQLLWQEGQIPSSIHTLLDRITDYSGTEIGYHVISIKIFCSYSEYGEVSGCCRTLWRS